MRFRYPLGFLWFAACFGSQVKDLEEFGPGRDSGAWDSGYHHGHDGHDGHDGQDGGSAGDAVSGAMAVYFRDGGQIGTWSVSGTVISCGSCQFGFDGDFEGIDIDSDINRTVEWDEWGYVYTDGGEYWGYGEARGGYAYWATYDASSSGYYYYGYVDY